MKNKNQAVLSEDRMQWHKKTPGRNGKARNLGLSTGGLLMEFFCLIHRTFL